MAKSFSVIVRNELEKKVEAVKRIGLRAEELSLEYLEEGIAMEDTFSSISSIHYPKGLILSPEFTDALNWSRALDNVFENNKKMDPTINGQFFVSSKGFMRHFPALESKQVDTDPRRRSWYTAAATGSKAS